VKTQASEAKVDSVLTA